MNRELQDNYRNGDSDSDDPYDFLDDEDILSDIIKYYNKDEIEYEREGYRT